MLIKRVNQKSILHAYTFFFMIRNNAQPFKQKGSGATKI